VKNGVELREMFFGVDNFLDGGIGRILVCFGDVLRKGE
jgi:hypothetical protein